MDIFYYCELLLSACFGFFQLHVFPGVPIWMLSIVILFLCLSVNFVRSWFHREG